jgi:hypothetical protein
LEAADFNTLAFKAEYPGILVDRNDTSTNKMTVYVNPEINDSYAKITLKNLKPGEFKLTVEPKVELELNSANINLDTFVKELYPNPAETPLTGKFPDGEGLDLSSIFEDMGTMGENINFDQLDLYLYMTGDREMLEGTEFEFTAQWSQGSHALTESGGQEFANLGKPFPDFSDSPFTGRLADDAQFYTPDLVDTINSRPSDLRME